jgi:glycosyltransferase involved in cell wall biosynthesis
MENHNPLISIVLPTYNGSKYIAESIQSCIDQCYRNWELIVVDDKSKDSTISIVEDFILKDDRIRLIKHEINKKLPGALNTGFAASRGEYLTWTSDDNRYAPYALHIMEYFLRNNNDTGMVYTDVIKMDEHGKDIGYWDMDSPEALVNGNCVQACFLYRRSVYVDIGEYDSSMFLVEDYDYWLRVLSRHKIHYMKGVAPYYYRRHAESLTNTRSLEVTNQTAKAIVKNITDKKQRDDCLDNFYTRILWAARKDNNMPLAMTCAVNLLKRKPWSLRRWRHFTGTLLLRYKITK